MTSNEVKALKDLAIVAKDIRDGFSAFKSTIENRVASTENRVDIKHLPINLEKDILSACQTAINDSIKSVLTGYNSPLSKLIVSVVDSHTSELRQIINDAFVSVIKTDEFKESIVSAFAHKVSRSIISNNDGLFDKVSNELKQDQQFKARMTLAVAAVVEECLKDKK